MADADPAAYLSEYDLLTLARLVVAAGPMPSTPNHAEAESAINTQRHALDMLSQSDRNGCAIGAAFALALDWAAMIYIGAAIYWTLELYTRAYGMAPTAAIAPINYFSVVLAGFWGWLFWDQIPDRWSVLGSVLVIIGGLLTLLLAHRNNREQPASS